MSKGHNPKLNILITGANGFVGSSLYDALSGDFRLSGLDIGDRGRYSPEDFFGWDRLDMIPPVDAVIHLAGKAHDTSGTAREQEYFEINLGLTQKIFDWFLKSSAEKFIFFSSVKAVADTVKGEWLTEKDEPDPQTAYGRSKLAAERYILQRFEEWEKEGARERGSEQRKEVTETGESSFLHNKSGNSGTHDPVPRALDPLPHALCPVLRSIYILRPAMIHGPGNKGNLNMLYKMVSKGLPWPLGAFENQRSFASIGNVVFAIRKILEGQVPPGIYNLADDETVSTNDLIRLIAKTIGKRSGIWKLPKGMIRLIARSGDLLHLSLNSERLKKLTENYRVSNSKIKSALGIECLPVSANDGFHHTLKSFTS